MVDTPGALQLRRLQTVVDVAAEKNSTLVMRFPVELLRFFDHASGPDHRSEPTATMLAAGTHPNGQPQPDAAVAAPVDSDRSRRPPGARPTA